MILCEIESELRVFGKGNQGASGSVAEGDH